MMRLERGFTRSLYQQVKSSDENMIEAFSMPENPSEPELVFPPVYGGM